MPSYPHLASNEIDWDRVDSDVGAMVTLGVPYDADTRAHDVDLARAQAKTISDEIVAQGGPTDLADKDVVALISYLQRLGADYARSIAKPAVAQGGN